MLSSLSVILLVMLPTLAPVGVGARAATTLGGEVRVSANPIGSGVASASPATRAPSAATGATNLLATASRYLGTRYKFGGTTPRAFDCSGFVRYVFARHGVELPRTAREQSAMGDSVAGGLDSLRAGDLLFFRTWRGRASHVAIYVGAGRIIHASSGSRRVRYDDLDSPRGRWFMTHVSGMRRVLADTAMVAE